RHARTAVVVEHAEVALQRLDRELVERQHLGCRGREIKIDVRQPARELERLFQHVARAGDGPGETRLVLAELGSRRLDAWMGGGGVSGWGWCSRARCGAGGACGRACCG